MQAVEHSAVGAKEGMKWVAWFALALTVLFGVHLRMVAYTDTQIEDPIKADARDYFAYALNLQNWNVFSKDFVAPSSPQAPTPDSLRSPGFPYFGKFFVANDVETMLANTLKAQTVVQVLAFLLLTWVFVEFLGLGWAIPAALLLWTFPHFVSINTYYLSESLFTSLLGMAIAAAWFSSRQSRPHIAGWAICGLLVGASALTRPVLDYFPLCMLLACLLFFRQHAKALVAFAAAALVPMLLWKLRNLFAIGEFADPTLLANSFLYGSYPGFMYQNIPESLAVPYRFDPLAAAASVDLKAAFNVVSERVMASPSEYLQWYLLDKPRVLWQWWLIEGQGDIYIYTAIKSPYYSLLDFHISHVVNAAVHPYWVTVGVVSAAVVALTAMFKKYQASIFVLFLGLIVVYAAAVHTVLAPYPRYGIPFKIVVILLAIWACKVSCAWLIELARSKGRSFA